MASPLHHALRENLKISDSEFAEKCGKHRTEIWNYRTGRRTPNWYTATAIRDALKKLGVTLAVEDIIGKRPTKKAA